jgi:hypothetical protein
MIPAAARLLDRVDEETFVAFLIAVYVIAGGAALLLAAW